MSPEGYLGHTADLVPEYDLKKAKELMKAAGQEKGFRDHHDRDQQPLYQ